MPRMFGMPPPLPNQSMAPTSPALGHTGASVTAQSKVDLNHIPRPIPSSVVILHATRQGNQANPPPVLCLLIHLKSIASLVILLDGVLG